jgi:hypothetical protein
MRNPQSTNLFAKKNQQPSTNNNRHITSYSYEPVSQLLLHCERGVARMTRFRQKTALQEKKYTNETSNKTSFPQMIRRAWI